MTTIENLKKENFWNDLHERYPIALQDFCDWIDDYKDSYGWDKIFQPGVKFHDVPFAIQYGIWKEYADDFGLQDRVIIMEEIIECFADVGK